MMVTFRTEGPPCACGLRPRGVEVASVRVNKRSLRATGFVLGAMPARCDECRLPLAQLRRIREMAAEDAVAVAAYRERRWPARPSNGPQSVQGSPSTGQGGFVALAGARPAAIGNQEKPWRPLDAPSELPATAARPSRCPDVEVVDPGEPW
jgi:hypothetical protein